MRSHSPLRVHLRHQALDRRRVLARGQAGHVRVDASCVRGRQSSAKRPPSQHRILRSPLLALAPVEVTEPSENRYNMCNRKTNSKSAKMIKFSTVHDPPPPCVHSQENVPQRLEPVGSGRRYEELHGHRNGQRNTLQILPVRQQAFRLRHSGDIGRDGPRLPRLNLPLLIASSSRVGWGTGSRGGGDGRYTMPSGWILDPAGVRGK
mmetsp:Transcript_32442/g.84236  ORF Transcript_32442/g.84236 Transcript_32442/m.84236 type:complete len:206 (-) Transcript_32442:1426-2043(-)